MRPLYLQGKAGMRVVYDEPALVVTLKDKTRQLFPLSRISRVVVTGYVDWSMGALFACAESGISVFFMDDSGVIKGRWIGKCQSDGPLQSLFTLLSEQNAESAYANWYKGMQRMAARSAARRLQFQDWRCADLGRVKQYVEQVLNSDWREVEHWLAGVISSAVTSYLLAFGVNAQCDSEIEWSLRLADDLADLLLTDFYPVLIKWAQASSVPPGAEALLQKFEARSDRLEHLIRGVVMRLYQALKENL